MANLSYVIIVFLSHRIIDRFPWILKWKIIRLKLVLILWIVAFWTYFISVSDFRLGVRCISSVVPKSDIAVSDFTVKNEPILGYLPGSSERTELEAALNKYNDVTEDCPIIIGGKEYRTDDVRYQVMVKYQLNPLHLPNLNNVCLFSFFYNSFILFIL